MDQRLPAEQGGCLGPKTRQVLAGHAEVDRDLSLAQDLGLTLGQFDELPDDERGLWIARWQRDQRLCPDCSKPIEECSDPERKNYPFRRVCYRSMEREAAAAAYAKLHEKAPYHDGSFTSWAQDRGPSHPYHFNDGVSIGVADHDVTPHDKFTTVAEASPVVAPEEDDQVLES